MKCQLCGGDIPSFRYGNALYCDEDCYKEAKRLRDAFNYQNIRCYVNDLKLNAKILAKYFPLCEEGDYMIQIKFFLNEGFNWDRYDELIVHQNQQLNVVGRYAYCVITVKNNEKEVMIWKLKDCQ